jgi:hypothetical protein
MFLPDEINEAFKDIKVKYGPNSIERVEHMLEDVRENRMKGQEKAKWILPGLSTNPWLSLSMLDNYNGLVSTLEENAHKIKAEISSYYKARMEKDSAAVRPYEHYLGHVEGWSAVYLFRNGCLQENIKDIMPDTVQIYSGAVLPYVCTLLESHFSIMAPCTHIAEHSDLWNFSINLHLAIEIPEKCGLQVNGEARTWTEGKCLLFDYSFIHSAWNNNETLSRICLLMDIWHPEVTLPEKEAIIAFVSTIRKMMSQT